MRKTVQLRVRRFSIPTVMISVAATTGLTDRDTSRRGGAQEPGLRSVDGWERHGRGRWLLQKLTSASPGCSPVGVDRLAVSW